MPDKSDRLEIELAKINVASQFKTSFFVTMVAAYLASLLVVWGIWYQTHTNHEDWLYYAGFIFVGAVIVVGAYFNSFRPFQRYLNYLNDAIKEIEKGNGIGDLNDVLKGKRKNLT